MEQDNLNLPKIKCYYCVSFEKELEPDKVLCVIDKKVHTSGCSYFMREIGSDDDLTMEQSELL
jgi:hypothetical protein